MARTDNDTWDLASSVGATATAVAASRAMASQGPEPLLDDPWADPLVRAVGIERFIKLVDGEVGPADDSPLNRQHMREQIAVRTRFFDDFFLQATGAGIRQAVILASGLDTRAYRPPWPAGTVVYEIDQPEVIEFKTRTLAGLGAETGRHANPTLVGGSDDEAADTKRCRQRPFPCGGSKSGGLESLSPSSSVIE